jgi:hypothetical protein
MPRSIDEIKADIARTQAEMRMRDQYTQGFNQPQTRVGWGSYIVNNDRGLLDAYQNREAQWKLTKEQQEAQALQAAIQRAWQEKENQKQRELTKAVAEINRSTAKDDRQEQAANTLYKLYIQKSQIASAGGDTREIDAAIGNIYRAYPSLIERDFTAPKYDIKQSADYNLAKYGDYTAKDYTAEELQEALDSVGKFETPKAASTYAKLERELTNRQKQDKAIEELKTQIAKWNGGALTDTMLNYGWSAKDGILFDKTGRILKRVKVAKPNNAGAPDDV